MILMIISPAAYTPEMVPSGLDLLIYFNPLSYFILCFQRIICYGQWPALGVFSIAVALASISFFGGYWFFRKAKFAFFDYA